MVIKRDILIQKLINRKHNGMVKASPRLRQAFDYDEVCRNEERLLELTEIED